MLLTNWVVNWNCGLEMDLHFPGLMRPSVWYIFKICRTQCCTNSFNGGTSLYLHQSTRPSIFWTFSCFGSIIYQEASTISTTFLSIVGLLEFFGQLIYDNKIWEIRHWWLEIVVKKIEFKLNIRNSCYTVIKFRLSEMLLCFA